ncbi:MAG: hypothetical protein ABSD12_26915, partial [Paraburkholderia sp.]
MKTTKLNQYCYGIAKGVAVLAAGVGLLASHAAYADSSDNGLKLAVAAGTPLPASGAAATTQLVQDDPSATGEAAYAATMADDVATIFSVQECRATESGSCTPHPRGG